jgi:hypothetical protein
MALVITQKVRESLNGKAFRVYEIVHDGTVLSISAGSMDMNYIQAIVGHHVYLSMQAPASTLMGCMRVSINASNTGVTWLETDANAQSTLTVIGW